MTVNKILFNLHFFVCNRRFHDQRKTAVGITWEITRDLFNYYIYVIYVVILSLGRSLGD